MNAILESVMWIALFIVLLCLTNILDGMETKIDLLLEAAEIQKEVK